MLLPTYLEAVDGLTAKFAATNPNFYVRMVIEDDGIAITCLLKSEARDRWVSNMLNDLDCDCNYEIVLCDPERKVMVVNFFDKYDDTLSATGVAKCSPTDQFDKNVGLAVAFAHAFNDDIPEYV